MKINIDFIVMIIEIRIVKINGVMCQLIDVVQCAVGGGNGSPLLQRLFLKCSEMAQLLQFRERKLLENISLSGDFNRKRPS